MQQIEKLYPKIEFWLATGWYIYVLTIIFKTTIRQDVPEVIPFIESKINFSYFFNYFLPKVCNATALFIAFLALSKIILPKFGQSKLLLTIISSIAIIAVLGTVFGISKTYLDTYLLADFSTLQKGYNNFFFTEFYSAFLIVVGIIIYYIIKELLINKIKDVDLKNDIPHTVKTPLLVASSIWFVGFIFIEFIRYGGEFQLTWLALVLAAGTTFIYAYHYILPQFVEKSKTSYYFKTFVFSIILCLPISIIIILIGVIFNANIDNAFFPFLIFYFPLILIFIAPLSRALFLSNYKKDKELNSLKGELSHSHSNLNLLKAQINPHFLFNTLNSLYGTAILEQAPLTSSGIQKLGDMMRFMLHENTQDYISLTRDIAYLEDYIELQKLRISNSSNTSINIQIEHPTHDLRIVPMLLIPFVENAYKYSISHLQASQIQVSLKTEDNMLYFDVMNSINPTADQKDSKSGIGIDNVRKRLEIFYKERHELHIHQTPQQYFVHLKIKL